MAKKETHVAPKVQSRKEWIAAVEDGTKTKQQAIARCKAMVAKYEARGGSMHGNLWAKWLAELEAKPKASVDQSFASLSKAELVEIVQAFMSKAK